MGIKGLLPALKGITRSVSIGQFDKVAVDGQVILHSKAAMAGREHVLSDGSRTIQDCMEQVRSIRAHGAEPLMVFDGGLLPLKAPKEEERNRFRVESYRKALKYEKAGDWNEADKHFKHAVAIKPEHVKRFLEALKAESPPVDFIVAPYEADAQMAFLVQTGKADAVLTQDSDLLTYGCKKVLLKMNFSAGAADQIMVEHLHMNEGFSFEGWDIDLFTQFCVLSGCDFLKNVPQYAITKVHRHIHTHKDPLKCIDWLRSVSPDVPPDFEQQFHRAYAVFRHQLVFCPDRQECVHLTPLPEGKRAVLSQGSGSSEGSLLDTCSSLDFLGPMIPPDLAAAIARGDINARTKQPFQDERSRRRVSNSSSVLTAGDLSSGMLQSGIDSDSSSNSSSSSSSSDGHAVTASDLSSGMLQSGIDRDSSSSSSSDSRESTAQAGSSCGDAGSEGSRGMSSEAQESASCMGGLGIGSSSGISTSSSNVGSISSTSITRGGSRGSNVSSSMTISSGSKVDSISSASITRGGSRGRHQLRAPAGTLTPWEELQGCQVAHPHPSLTNHKHAWDAAATRTVQTHTLGQIAPLPRTTLGQVQGPAIRTALGGRAQSRAIHTALGRVHNHASCGRHPARSQPPLAAHSLAARAPLILRRIFV